jgi:hypothetical protein
MQSAWSNSVDHGELMAERQDFEVQRNDALDLAALLRIPRFQEVDEPPEPSGPSAAVGLCCVYSLPRYCEAASKSLRLMAAS